MSGEHAAVTPAAAGADAHTPMEKNGPALGYPMKLFVHSSKGDSGGCVIVCESSMQIRFVESKLSFLC